MIEETPRILPRRSVLLLLSGVVLVVSGVALILYAYFARFSVAEFLEKGIPATATIRSIEARGAKHGGRLIEVSFWEKRDGQLLGELQFATITDLLPIRAGGEKSGDEIAVRWFRENGRLRVAPESSLNRETRSPEFQFAFGIGLAAIGGILLGVHSMREARRRERPGEML